MLPYIAEFIGTMLLILLGDGVVANVTLNKSGMKGAGSIQITFAWGLAVMVPAFIFGAASGADLLLFCGGAAADDVRAAPGVSGAEPAGCAGLLCAAARLAQPVADTRPARAVSGADGGAQCTV